MPWEQLMLALSQCGQTEALTVFRQAREKLIDKAGVDPGPDLATTAGPSTSPGPDTARVRAGDLFAERAQAVDPHDITSCRAEMVRICEALDGLPTPVTRTS